MLHPIEMWVAGITKRMIFTCQSYLRSHDMCAIVNDELFKLRLAYYFHRSSYRHYLWAKKNTLTDCIRESYYNFFDLFPSFGVNETIWNKALNNKPTMMLVNYAKVFNIPYEAIEYFFDCLERHHTDPTLKWLWNLVHEMKVYKTSFYKRLDEYLNEWKIAWNFDWNRYSKQPLFRMVNSLIPSKIEIDSLWYQIGRYVKLNLCGDSQ